MNIVKRAVGLIALFMLCFMLLTSSAASAPLEQTVGRRQSMRSYTSENISSQHLLGVLWAAYGTVLHIAYEYSIIVFPVNMTGSYRYIPESNSVVVHDLTVNKETLRPHNQNWPSDASVVLVLVWNQTRMGNQYFASAEAGLLVQNVYLAAASLDLGTCCVGGVNSGGLRNDLKLSSILIPLLVMPLGYPTTPYPPASPNYDFMVGNLPPVQYSDLSFEEAVRNIVFTRRWSAENLSLQELSQLLWAAYGYTNVTQKTTYHRTTPSANGIYPLIIFVSNATGVYRYLPETHSVVEVSHGDKRFDIADACAGQVWAANASSIFLVVYDSSYNDGNTGDGGTFPHMFMEVNVGAVIQQLFLEASAWNLGVNAISQGLEDWNGTGAEELRNILGLSPQLIPLYVVPIGPVQLATDINGDGKVNILDIAIVAKAFGSTPEDLNWNIAADLNNDQIIDILDIATVAKDFGKTATHHLLTIDALSQNPDFTAVEPYQNVTVTVDVVDEGVGIREVILSYTIDGVQTWTNITMNNLSDNTYAAKIPGFEADTHVQYKIIAYDHNNNSVVEDKNGEYYIYTVAPEYQKLLIFIFMLTILVVVILTRNRKQSRGGFHVKARAILNCHYKHYIKP